MSKLTFVSWMRMVNTVILNRVGMHADDLPDWDYRTAYENGLTPQRAAAKSIQYAKRELGV